MKKNDLEREQWLVLMGECIMDDIIDPVIEELGLDLPQPPVRYSVGFAPRSKGKELGCCFNRSVSADGHNEIFISPICDDSATIAATLVHELIHAYLDNEDGHKGRFAKIAKKAGLTGPMTATNAGAELADFLKALYKEIGDIPAAKIKLTNMPKGQKARMIKVECIECSFIFRASRAQIQRLSKDAPCPCCGGESLDAEL